MMLMMLMIQVEDLYETPAFLWLPGVAGPKFNMTTRRVTMSNQIHHHQHPHTLGGLAYGFQYIDETY